MVWFISKILISAVLISYVSWLSGKKGELAGFLTALPLTSMIALGFSQIEWNNSEVSVNYAKSIFAAIPLSLLFFVPFLLANKISLPFWGYYLTGLVLLTAGYFLHKYIV
jgi:hypothetical protein